MSGFLSKFGFIDASTGSNSNSFVFSSDLDANGNDITNVGTIQATTGVFDNITVSGQSDLQGNIISSAGDVTINDDAVVTGDLTVNGVLNYSSLNPPIVPGMTSFTVTSNDPIKVNTSTNSENVTDGESMNLSLAPSGVTPNTYTNANLTVDSYGRITSASNGTSGTMSSFTLTSSNPVKVNTSTNTENITNGESVNLSLAPSGVTANTYTLPSSLTVTAEGLISSITSGSAPLTKSIVPSANFTVSGDASVYAPNATNLNIDLVDRFVSTDIWGDSTHIPQIVINEKGVAVSAANLSIPPFSISTTGPISATSVVPIGGSISIDHSLSGVVASTYGNGSTGSIASISVNSTGHISSASSTTLPSVTVSGTASEITGTGSVFSSNGSNITFGLANFGTAQTIGSSSTTPIITTDAKGRVSSITSTAISNTALDSIPTRNWKAGTGSSITGSDNVAIGDIATITSIRSNVIGSGAQSTGVGDNNVIGYQSLSTGTLTNILGRGSVITANNANVIGEGITNSTANTTIIGSGSLSDHIVNSTGFFRPRKVFSAQATNTANIALGALPAIFQISNANVNWNDTTTTPVVSGNSLFINDTSALFHVECAAQLVITNATGTTDQQYTARLRYFDQATPSTICQQTQYYSRVTGVGNYTFTLNYSLSGYVKTAAVIGTGQSCQLDLARNAGNGTVTQAFYRITAVRVA